MMNKSINRRTTSSQPRRAGLAIATLAGIITWAGSVNGADIVHDAEHLMIAAQRGEEWAKEDAEIDAMLAGIRAKNGGKPPNITPFLPLSDPTAAPFEGLPPKANS